MHQSMTIHEATIKLLKRDYPIVKTNGFQRAVNSLVVIDWRRESRPYTDLYNYRADLAEGEYDGPIDLNNPSIKEQNPFRYIPDAFFADFNTQMMVVFEVEDHHRLDLEKLESYYETYFEILDPLGWGLALISVDRWGARRAVPYFDYVFADHIDSIPPRTLLHSIKEVMRFEKNFAEEACKPLREWNPDKMFELVAEARLDTNHVFWRDPKTAEAFCSVFNRKKRSS